MEKKTAIAFGLIVVVIILLPYYYKIILPPEEMSEFVPDLARTIQSDSAVVSPPPHEITAEISVEEEFKETGIIAGESRIDAGGFLQEDNPELIYVESPIYRIGFSTRGAVCISALLYQYDNNIGESVELIRDDADENLNIVLFTEKDILDTRSYRFTPNKRELIIPENGEGSITFRAESPEGAWIQKKFIFSGDRYPFQMFVEAGGIDNLDRNYEVVWGSGMAITEADTTQDIYYAEAYAYMGGELESFKGKGDKDISGQANGHTEWVAQRNKYFEVAILPETHEANGVRFGIKAQPLLGKHRPKVYRMVLRMDGQMNQTYGQYTVFLGPIDQAVLKDVHPALEETMNWGWPIIEPFSKLVLLSLKGLHKIIPNYGLVLIVFSILVKIVVWPLTHKSTKSMSRMSAIQPKMKELQEKYKGKQEKLNKAMMQLYKEEGVNPFSSCWPMMLQMPLLYALFIIFRSTIELRQAPFMLWINDLSAPDIIINLPYSFPLYGSHIALLPIFMGATQILMSKVTMTDPKQKPMLYMMPVFMVLIFNNFPSGLTLYYALFNLWTYLQQTYLKRQGVLPTTAPSKS